jgi:outer membrane protein OmpA-like peptidoglycan-associated protein
VWVIGKDDKAEQRLVEVGDWQSDDLFIDQGLQPGERVVVDGAIRLSGGATVKVVGAHVPTASEAASGAPTRAAPPLPGTERLRFEPPGTRPPTATPTAAASAAAIPMSFFFGPGSATLNAASRTAIATLAGHLKENADTRVHITGYVDKTGNRARNLELAQKRAHAIHRFLREEGVSEHQLNLKAPDEIIGSPNDRLARRVDVHPALPLNAPSTPAQGK